MLSRSDEAVRHRVLKTKAVSHRFKVRAIAGMLPTHLHEFKRLRDGNDHAHIYADNITGGKCICALMGRCTPLACCCSAVTTMEHAMAHCLVSEDVREHARDRVRALWADGHDDSEPATQYMSSPPAGWLPEWTWLGMVPLSVTQHASRMTQGQINTAALILAKAGTKVWEARNEEAAKWAEISGVAARKTEVRRRQGRARAPCKRPGRPCKEDADLAPGYRLKKRRARHFEAAATGGVRADTAKASWSMAVLAERTGQPKLDSMVVPVTRDMVASQFSKKPSANEGRHATPHVGKRQRKLAASLRKRLPDGAKPGTLMDAYTTTTYMEELPHRADGKKPKPCILNRSLTVDYDDVDDVIILPGASERVGRVAGFIWCDHGGYRQPDTMDIAYVEDGQQVLEEVSLTDPTWVRAGPSTRPDMAALTEHARCTIAWAAAQGRGGRTSAIRQRIEADCMLLAVPPTEWWAILNNMGFLHATGMSEHFWGATIVRMNTAYASMAPQSNQVPTTTTEERGTADGVGGGPSGKGTPEETAATAHADRRARAWGGEDADRRGGDVQRTHRERCPQWWEALVEHKRQTEEEVQRLVRDTLVQRPRGQMSHQGTT